MHIAMFLDQHPDSLGGAQLSVKLQAKYLEKLGHTVTLCSPHSKGITNRDVVELPSLPITLDGHYQLAWPSKRQDKYIDKAFAGLPPVDVVHVHGEYWGAVLGFSFARRHKLPSVITVHTNLAIGTVNVLGPIASRLFLWLLDRALRKHLKIKPKLKPASSWWQYLARLGDLADIRLSPTAHFARTLEAHGVSAPIGVLSNGLDDEGLEGVTLKTSLNIPPRLVWAGRLSKEKRLEVFLEAIKLSGVDAQVSIYGNGELMGFGKKYIKQNNLANKVTFHGAVNGHEMLQRIANSEILVQTSVGFETQGRTVFEALALNVPVILSDPNIAEDFEQSSYWLTEDDSVEALAATLRQAVSEMTGGSPKQVSSEYRQKFLQSKLSQDVEAIYRTLVDENI